LPERFKAIVSVSGYLISSPAVTLMQPLYGSLFKGLSENELDHILSSFSAKH
jgi:endoglucanase